MPGELGELSVRLMVKIPLILVVALELINFPKKSLIIFTKIFPE